MTDKERETIMEALVRNDACEKLSGESKDLFNTYYAVEIMKGLISHEAEKIAWERLMDSVVPMTEVIQEKAGLTEDEAIQYLMEEMLFKQETLWSRMVDWFKKKK